jgi:hypothetical protein
MPSAARALAATPDSWGDFMQGNAELAANVAGVPAEEAQGPGAPA